MNDASRALVRWVALEHPQLYPFVIMVADATAQAVSTWSTFKAVSLYFYGCAACGALLRPKHGDCCVICSYGSVPCPPGIIAS